MRAASSTSDSIATSQCIPCAAFAPRATSSAALATAFSCAFVACGFEHSVANMFFLPLGFGLTVSGPDPLSWTGALLNLGLVTIGNLIGGTGLVALVYWFVYLRHGRGGTEPSQGAEREPGTGRVG